MTRPRDRGASGARTDEPLDLLTPSWAAAWADALNQSTAFAAAAARFAGKLGFVMSADPAAGLEAERRVIVEVENGRCVGAHTVESADLLAARYVLRASPGIWREILHGRLDAVSAVLSGKLRLARGSLLTIRPQLPMARELLAVAAGLETRFPAPRT